MYEEIINGILGDPNYRGTLFSMPDFKEKIVARYRKAASLKQGDYKYERVPQVVYEIMRYELRKDSIHHDERFWQDVYKLTRAKCAGWVTEEEGRLMINEIKNNTIPRDSKTAEKESPVYRLIKGICEYRLRHLDVDNDPANLYVMVNFVFHQLCDNDFALLKRLESTGNIKKYIRSIVDTNFIKERYAKITEVFKHPSKKDCGYAHLSIKIDRSRLEDIFGNNWYEREMRDTFQTSVEKYYKPYDNSPIYVDNAQYNKLIAEDMEALFLKLKEREEIRASFPAKYPRVSYNQTFAKNFVIEVRFGEGMKELGLEDTAEDEMPAYNVVMEPELVFLSDAESGDGNTQSPQNEYAGLDMDSEEDTETNDDIKDPEANRPINLEQAESIDLFDEAFKQRLNDVNREVIILKHIRKFDSADIGVILYKKGLIRDGLLHGYPFDSEEGRRLLARHVNNHLTPQANEAFRNALQDFSYEDICSWFKYIEKGF